MPFDATATGEPQTGDYNSGHYDVINVIPK